MMAVGCQQVVFGISSKKALQKIYFYNKGEPPLSKRRFPGSLSWRHRHTSPSWKWKLFAIQFCKSLCSRKGLDSAFDWHFYFRQISPIVFPWCFLFVLLSQRECLNSSHFTVCCDFYLEVLPFDGTHHRNIESFGTGRYESGRKKQTQGRQHN